MWHHAYAACALVLAWLVSRCRAVHVSVKPEPDRATESQGRRASVYLEYLPLACAVLSVLYWVCIAAWEQASFALFWQGLYHVTWAYLRLLYTALFGVYWLHGLPSFPSANKIASGFGLFYFVVLSPMAETSMTHHLGTAFPQKDGRVTDIGQCAHRMESMTFFWSMMLCCVHGLTLGFWQDGSVRFDSCMTALAIVTFAVIAVCSGRRALLWEAFSEAKVGFWFRMIYYVTGYFIVILATSYRLWAP